MSTLQPAAGLSRLAYSLYPLPVGYPFCKYADLAHGGNPGRYFGPGDLELPVPTEQQWQELNRLAPLAERAGYWLTLTQLGPGQPLRLTTTPKGSQPHEAGLQWCDTEPHKAAYRAGHYLRGKLERQPRAGVGEGPDRKPLAA